MIITVISLSDFFLVFYKILISSWILAFFVRRPHISRSAEHLRQPPGMSCGAVRHGTAGGRALLLER